MNKHLKNLLNYLDKLRYLNKSFCVGISAIGGLDTVIDNFTFFDYLFTADSISLKSLKTDNDITFQIDQIKNFTSDAEGFCIDCQNYELNFDLI